MARSILLACLLFAVIALGHPQPTLAAQTVITLPQDVQWQPIKEKGAPPGAFEAWLRGKQSDKCDQMQLAKFPDGYVYPWHVNNVYGIFTILKGTLVIGFDKSHAVSSEKPLPAGTVMQGLKTEPHYGRAIGETIFEIYWPCQ
jgi:hypothetical protein